MAAPTRDTTELGLQLGVIIGNAQVDPSLLSLHLHASIRCPYVRATLRVQDVGGIGALDTVVVGATVAIAFTAGENFSESFALPMTIVSVKLPQSNNTRTPAGELELGLVSLWAYNQKSAPIQAYADVTDVASVIRDEIEYLGLTKKLARFEEPVAFDTPRNIFRTRDVLHTIDTNILPWVRTSKGAALFWYQKLDGFVDIQSAPGMLDQTAVAALAPAYMPIRLDGEDLVYVFESRSYKTNPKRTDLFEVSGHYYDEGLQTFEEAEPVDTAGRAIQFQRSTGADTLDIWYTGNRPPEQMHAHAAYMRRNHLFHQLHTLIFKEIEMATVCQPGTKVRLYDYDLYLPEQGTDADKGHKDSDMEESAMSSEYIVSDTHMFIDGINNNGFTGTKLELAKLGYTESELSDVADMNGYVEV